MTAPDRRRASAFGRNAEEYERWRPGYPDAAVDWLLPPDARHVADVGAGTGKLTGALLARGLAVDAVEPDPDMLAVLRRRHPAARALLAGAESLPLDDASVDAVLVGQAWHWFTPADAVREVRRVLRPGGRLGLLWSGPTPGEGWIGELAALDPDAGSPARGDSPVAAGLPPDEVETTRIGWTWSVSPDDVRSALATHSGLAVMDPGERTRVLDRAHAVVAAECARVQRAAVPWPQTCVCLRWQPIP